jgi:hypothetical protein
VCPGNDFSSERAFADRAPPRFTAGKRNTDRYQPPGKAKKDIRKVTACEGSVGSFALLSSAGDVYLYNTEDVKKERDGSMKKPVPQLVWAVRKQFTAVEVGARRSLHVKLLG